MRCRSCGSELPALATTCPACRAVVDQTGTISLPSISPDDHSLASDLSHADRAAVDALPSGSALLIVQRGPSAGSRFLLDQDETNAGRHPDSAIFLDDVTVSRRHALFRRVDNSFRVEDAGSLNGTYVNRERVETALLSNGDEVQIGKFRLIFFSGVGA